MYIQTYFYDLYSSLWMYQQLDVWCCNSHGDLAKILEKTCHARSPCKEEELPLVGMYLHKELIIAMKVIIILF